MIGEDKAHLVARADLISFPEKNGQTPGFCVQLFETQGAVLVVYRLLMGKPDRRNLQEKKVTWPASPQSSPYLEPMERMRRKKTLSKKLQKDSEDEPKCLQEAPTIFD